MLKLTSAAGYRGSIYITAAHITILHGTENGTKIWVTGGNVEIVLEKVAEIMAMPEMVKHLNPLYQVPFNPIDQLAETFMGEKMA